MVKQPATGENYKCVKSCVRLVEVQSGIKFSVVSSLQLTLFT